MQLDASTGFELILKAKTEERDARIFQQWVAQLPVMAMTGKPVSFADYKDKVTGANIDCRPAAEIMAELAEVEKELSGGGDADGS